MTVDFVSGVDVDFILVIKEKNDWVAASSSKVFNLIRAMDF